MSVRLVSISRLLVFTFCLGLLAGCAPGVPLLKQLQSENIQRIAVFVEEGPFQYTVPTFAEAPYVGGGAATALFGVVGTLSVQMRLNQANAALNTAAKARGLTLNHRQAFAELLVQRLRERGVIVDLVPAAYGKGLLTSNRFFFQPSVAAVQKLPKDFPSFYLTIDFGSCTMGVVTPCIRYSLNSTGVVTSPGPVQKYTGFSLIEPNLWDPVLSSDARRFASVEDAVTRIAEFDAALAMLSPKAAESLVKGLERGREKPR
ncbi:hypothetical protein [Polaromonas sp.]|uniref:hypothetical protein n=1 Tax=Polaromonas sp. TaxID=1869339 RepID=UPI003C89A0ED